MDMQREDFLALTRGAAGFNEQGEPGYYGSKTFVRYAGFKGWVPLGSGMSKFEQRRILDDWFPAGEIFIFLNTTCFSRGVVSTDFGYTLKVLAPSKSGGMEEVFFGVREALSIAKQISVDTINRMNGVNHYDR